ARRFGTDLVDLVVGLELAIFLGEEKGLVHLWLQVNEANKDPGDERGDSEAEQGGQGKWKSLPVNLHDLLPKVEFHVPFSEVKPKGFACASHNLQGHGAAQRSIGLRGDRGNIIASDIHYVKSIVIQEPDAIGSRVEP